MATEDNGNGVGILKALSSSNEDISEYTDADESISAPTEFLAEFLSAVMLKDYLTALKYCKLILQYEPNNVTAKEFYPLILEKLQLMHNDQEREEEDVEDDEENEQSNSSSSGGSSDSESTSSDSSSEEDDDDDDEEEEDDDEDEMGEEGEAQGVDDKRSKGSSSEGGDATTGSYSSLEDDEGELDQLVALATKLHIDNVNIGNGNKIYDSNDLTMTTNKSSILAARNQMFYANNETTQQAAALPFGSSDSESPTEPVTQQTIAMLRAKVVPNKN